MSLVEMLHIHRSRIWFFTRYGISGICGALVQTFSLYFWISVLGLKDRYLGGAVLGFVLALVITFLLQKYWTFRDKLHHRVHKQFALYFFAALVNLAINLGLLELSKIVIEGFGRDFFHLWYLAAQAVIVFIAAAASFLLNYFFTFRSPEV